MMNYFVLFYFLYSILTKKNFMQIYEGDNNTPLSEYGFFYNKVNLLVVMPGISIFLLLFFWKIKLRIFFFIFLYQYNIFLTFWVF
jgi:hypothetical protein